MHKNSFFIILHRYIYFVDGLGEFVLMVVKVTNCHVNTMKTTNKETICLRFFTQSSPNFVLAIT